MPIISPQDAAAKWASNLSGATTHIEAGIRRVTQSPGPKAAAQKAFWLSQIQRSADKWAARLNALDLGTWQQATLTKGLPRIASGAQAAQGKYASFATSFFPHLESGVAKVKAMPKNSLADSGNRMLAMMNHNAQFKRS